MKRSEPSRSLHATLARAHQAVIGSWAARSGLRTVALVAVGFAAALLAGVLQPVGEAVSWVRLVALAALCATGLGVGVALYRRHAPRFDTYLEQVERRFPEVRSWLRNGLDFQIHPPQHASTELAGALSSEAARRLEAVPLERWRPRLEPRRPALALIASVITVVILGAAAPERLTHSWTTLWNPRLAAPPLRLEVEPGAVKVTPGASLTVRARVWGSARVPSLLRDGEANLRATSEGRAEGGARLWRFDLSQLTREQEYRVRIAGLESTRYRISLAGEPLPVSFLVEYRAPSYARLPVQSGAATRGDLAALRGTQARIEVTFDRDLTGLSVTLPGGTTRSWKPLTARRWSGEIPLDREGEYELLAQAASGEAGYRYRISPLSDAPPVIAVRLPTGDLDLPAGQQVPLEVVGQDDLGLTELKLQFRKDPTAPWASVPLASFADRPRETTVHARWDASSLALLPGETAAFRFELWDNNAVSGRGRAVSPTFELRFPSLADLYEHLEEAQGGIQSSLEKTVEQARELQASLDKLARQQGSSPSSTPSFERSEELKSALRRQAEISQRIDTAAQQLAQSLEQAAEREAFNQELMRKLREMHELMAQVQSPEFREALRRMEEALEDLNRPSLDQELPEWREWNRQMLTNLERSIELLKQLRQEERLESLARRAEELKARQDALNREHRSLEQSGDPKSRAPDREALSQRQERAATESEQLSRDASELARGMENSEERQALEKTASEIESEAARRQREASRLTSQNQTSAGRQRGEEASEALENAARQLASLVDALRSQREGVDLAAVRRAAKDLVSLQRESERNLGSGRALPERADRQTDLSEGVSRVADSLYQLSRRSPFISPRLGEALGRAISSLSASGRQLGSGNRQAGEQTGRSGSTALNEAVLELRRTESSMCKAPGEGGERGPSGQMTQSLGEMGERQSQLNSETRTLAQRLSQQMRLSAGDRQQLERLAEQQQRLRQQLEQFERDEEARQKMMGRLEAIEKDMGDVEELLRAGETGGELEQKQQRILSRLLDAQRSIHRRDFDPQRESRPGEDMAQRSAPEIPRELLGESDRLRLDLLKAEADRYPAQYRAFIEAYLRRLNGSRP